MLDLIDQQLGRILLTASFVWAGTAFYLNSGTQVTFTEESSVKNKSNIQVKLDTNSLATANPEIYFPDQDAEHYRGRKVYPFVPPVKIFIFEPVDLDVPQTILLEPPKVLPSPGPALEGTNELPRWGKDLPPVVIKEDDVKKNRK